MAAPDPSFLEPHFTPKQLATSWQLSISYIQRRFRSEPGTVTFGRAIRIPFSVAERVHRIAAQRSVLGPIRFQRYEVRWTKGGAIERTPIPPPRLKEARPKLDTFPLNVEPHVTVTELAIAWNVSVDFIRRRFEHEPGIVRFGRAMRIPRSVAEKVYEESRNPDGTIGPAPRDPGSGHFVHRNKSRF